MKINFANCVTYITCSDKLTLIKFNNVLIIVSYRNLTNRIFWCILIIPTMNVLQHLNFNFVQFKQNKKSNKKVTNEHLFS